LSTNQLRKFVDIFISIEHYPNALRFINRILESDHDTELMKIAGDISFKLGDYETTLDYFNTILILNKENAYAKQKVEEIKKIIEAIKAPPKKEETGEKIASKETRKIQEQPQEANRKTIKVENKETVSEKPEFKEATFRKKNR